MNKILELQKEFALYQEIELEHSLIAERQSRNPDYNAQPQSYPSTALPRKKQEG